MPFYTNSGVLPAAFFEYGTDSNMLLSTAMPAHQHWAVVNRSLFLWVCLSFWVHQETRLLREQVGSSTRVQ